MLGRRTARYPVPRGPATRVRVTDRRITNWLANRPRSERRPGDAGFVLLETLVSIGLISVVMAAFTTFFVSAVMSTNNQRATQTATRIANSAMESLRALPASDPVIGHDASSVLTQFAAAPPAVTPWLQGMEPATDPLAPTGSGATAVVPTSPVRQVINTIDYRVATYLGTCVIPNGTTRDASCGSGATTTGIGYLRAVVAVTWAAARCPSGGCAYLTSTLLSPVDDPLFNESQFPASAPVLADIAGQTSAVGDIVALVPTFTAAPTFRFAITTGSLPAGLVLDTATGVITGTPSEVTSSTPLVLTLSDGFGRATTARFSWTVVPALTTTPPPAQASFIGTALSLTLPAASGGVPGYTWSDPAASLPPGLVVSTVDNAAVITGTPTTRGVFAVRLTVTDSTTTRHATVDFTWTTDYPPMVPSNPGPQTSTVGGADSVTLSVTGGSGSFVWTSGAGLPAGLTVSSAGVVSGIPTTAGVTPVALLVTDTVTGTAQSVPFSWTVHAQPSVASPGNQSVTVGAAVSLQLTTTCPNAPCSYVINNGPATFGISAGGRVTGTVTGTAQTFGSVTIAVTDSAGVTVTSTSFAVTVNAAPGISSPGSQSLKPGEVVSLNVAGLTTGGTAPLTFAAADLPPWLALNTSTGLITGTAPGTAGTTSGTFLTVTDALGFWASTPTFSWTVGGVPPTAPQSVVVASGDSAVTPSWTAPTTGPVTSYTATLSPGGASCTTAGLSCVIAGLTNGVASSVTVTATNAYGAGPASPAVPAIPYPAAVMSAANGMTSWLDGSDPTALVAGSGCTGAAATAAIGCWRDKSGQPVANDFVQATAANQPTVGRWNNLAAVNFADTSDVLNSVTAAANYRTVFVAADVTNTATYINLFSQSGVDYNVRIGSGAVRSAPNGNDWSFDPAGTFNWANGSKLTNANGPIKIITTDQARSVKTFTASVSNALYGRGVVGQVGDVITFGKVLTTAERRAVEDYLARKWAVPITPQVPTSVEAVRSSENSATVSWEAPSFDGGTPVTGYTVTSAPDGKTCTTTTNLSCKVSDLTKKTTHTFTVTATNAVGIGPASALSNPVTP